VSLHKYLQDRNMVSSYTCGDVIGPPHTWRNKQETQTSLIDYIFIPEDLKSAVVNTKIHNSMSFETSDHFPVSVSFLGDNFISGQKQWSTRPLKWLRANQMELDMYRTEVDLILGSTIPDCHNINKDRIENYCDAITSALHSSAAQYIPRGVYRPYLKPYWKGSSLDYYHFHMREAKRNWVSRGKPRDKSDPTYCEYKKQKCEFRRQHRQAKRQWNKEKYINIAAASEVDIGEFYRTVRKQRRKKESVTTLEYGGSTADTPASICELWGEYYSHLLSPLERSDFDKDFYLEINKRKCEIARNQSTEGDGDVIMHDDFTSTEIQSVIKGLKLKKAPGPDCITNEHIHYSSPLFIKHLTCLFNMMIRHCYLPMSFRVGTIIPLYKGNNKVKSNPSNYRGITLTSAVGKIFEKILLNRIEAYLQSKTCGFPHKLQCGFRKGYGATISTFIIKEVITQYIDRGSNIFTVFLDNEKAFDRIWHNGLLVKLYNLGIRGRTWRLIQQSYEESSAIVMHDGCSSSAFSLKQGVGQGRVLSAFMFLVYIDDLIKELDKLSTGPVIGGEHVPGTLLADDTTLISPTPTGLQSMLSTLHLYSIRWRLTYNPDKSCVIVFRGGPRTDTNCRFRLGENILPIENSTVYAGSWVTNTNQAERTRRACAKARRTICSLKDVGLRAGVINPIGCVTIWQRVILPCAFYACEMWTNITKSEFEEMERIQRLFARISQNLHKRSSTLATIQSLGLWSMEGTIDKLKLMLLGRLCRADVRSVHKRIFYNKLGQYMVANIQPGSVTHDILNIANKYDLWHILTEFTNTGFFPSKVAWNRIVSSKIADCEYRRWQNLLSQLPGMSRYAAVHNALVPHRLWGMCELFPATSKCMFSLVKLCVLPVTEGRCMLCECECDDIVKHQLLSCSQLVEERNSLSEQLFDCMEIHDYLKYEDCDDDEEKIVTLLGGVTHIVEDMTYHEWADFISIVARSTSSWQLKSMLYL